jgi:hypothetical protein
MFEPIRFVLEVQDLAGFMALEVASGIEAGAKGKFCGHCRKFFLYGPKTGNRSHAIYCAEKCRAAAMRARNAKKDTN